MSLFTTLQARCPVCDAEQEVETVASVNADRRPDLRDAIVDGSFQETICDGCGATFRMPPQFAYVDFERGQWIAAHPGDARADWASYEVLGAELFAATFGAAAPASVREMGNHMQRRVTFGWLALREKILCRGHGLDDVTIELLKTALMRNVSDAPYSDQTELRLDASTDDNIALAWYVIGTEQCLSRIVLPHRLYSEIENDNAAWADLRDAFRDAIYVDLQRLIG